MTDYELATEYLYNQLPMFSVAGPGAYKPGLQTAHLLDDAFGNPHKAYKTIHVAGTNGKGSTSNMIASVLSEAGFRVGLYTSPHIFDFRERIRVDGKKISEEAVVDFVKRYRDMDLDCEPSFFELTTIMAFEYFRNQNVDIAVIETGLGGRLDTTNIITPVLTVITNVSLDHTSLLGNTPEAIAVEKAGIIKPGIPVVVGKAEGNVREVFLNKANESASEIIFAGDTKVKITTDDAGDTLYAFNTDGTPMIRCNLKGKFQEENVNTVIHALDRLGYTTRDQLRRGLENVTRNTGLIGRWTIVRESSPKVIIDTGHNTGAWDYLIPALNDEATKAPLRVVLGFVADKEIDEIFSRLPKEAHYYFVTPSTKRGRDSRQLYEIARNYGLDCKCYPTVAEGCMAAYSDSKGESTIFIGGSNYVIAEIKLEWYQF